MDEENVIEDDSELNLGKVDDDVIPVSCSLSISLNPFPV